MCTYRERRYSTSTKFNSWYNCLNGGITRTGRERGTIHTYLNVNVDTHNICYTYLNVYYIIRHTKRLQRFSFR